MADLPFEPADAALAARLAACLDLEGKIPRAFEALGPIAGRSVALLDGASPMRAAQLSGLGAELAVVDGLEALADGSVDVVVSCWTGFRGPSPEAVAQADRALRPGGRLLVLHDYGRDDVSRLRGDLPEYGLWSRRDGWFLTNGFKIRVVHCFWTFASIDEAGALLADLFGPAGEAVAATLRRPRLSYNVAVYHRPKGGAAPSR